MFPEGTNTNTKRVSGILSHTGCCTVLVCILDSAAWRDTLSVLAARGRAQVSIAAATTDWPKRIRDMRYDDQDDHGTAD